MLKAYIQAPEPEPEIQWKGIERLRQHRRRVRRARRWAGGVAGLVLAATPLFFLRPSATTLKPVHPKVAQGVQAAVDFPELPRLGEAGPVARPQTATLRLTDGSEVHTPPGTRVHLCKAALGDPCVALDEGEGFFSVQRRDRGAFRVQAGRVEIKVVGTAFLVQRVLEGGLDTVTIEVHEGSVEVTVAGGATEILIAGDRWSLATPLRAPPEREHDLATNLWNRARAHARAGEHEAAADAYRMFLLRHRSDGRAPLCALELGRLRMDVLDDPTGAVVPLRRAARQRGAVGEDALARLVRALGILGRREECMKARADYQNRFPRGVHRHTVQQSCGD